MRKLTRLMGAVAIAGAMGLGSPTPATAAVLTVGPDGWQMFTSIQDAVDVAADGDVIKVFQGIYPEQVVIRDIDLLSVQGEQAIITVPGSEMTGSLVKIVDSEEFHFTGFTIDGDNGVNVTPGVINGGGDADTRFYGMLVVNSSGQIVKNTIQNVSWHTGAQQGIGLYVLVTDGVERGINIRENVITNFQKGGMSVRGPIRSKIHKNTITHWGEKCLNAGNGIQVDGGTTSITSNVVSGSLYYEEPDCTVWGSAAMLLMAWTDPGDNFRVVRNTVSNSDVGIWFVNYGAGLTNAKAISNTFRDNLWNLLLYGTDDVKIHASKYE